MSGVGDAIEPGNGATNGDVIRLPHGSADLVIMNPPFTRPTNHEAGYAAPVPSFAGFATSDDEQKQMSVELKNIRGQLAEPAGNGNAGLASNFMDLAHQKVKPGSVLALVLPVTVVSGGAWAAARRLLARHYRDVTVITLATTGQTSRSFSADTGMGEALIVAVKRSAPIKAIEADAPTLYVNLRRRPRRTVDATEIARVLARLPSRATGLIHIGDDEIGCYVRASLADGGCASLREPDAAAAALELPRGSLRLPHLAEPFPLPIAALADLGTRGLVDRDIAGEEKNRAGAPRGPLDVFPHREGTPTYPMLWAHDAARERRLVVAPDSEGRVRPQRDQHAIEVWETATRLHFNRDFRLNSQSLAACLTPERSIGGRAWPNFRVEGDSRREEALALWANTTPGLIAFWWVGGRQQQGRAILTISNLPSLPALDVRTLTEPQLRLAVAAVHGVRSARPAAGQRGLPRRDAARLGPGGAVRIAGAAGVDPGAAVAAAPPVVRGADGARREVDAAGGTGVGGLTDPLPLHEHRHDDTLVRGGLRQILRRALVLRNAQRLT